MKENLFNNNSVGYSASYLKKKNSQNVHQCQGPSAKIPKFIPEQSYLVFRCIFSK